MDLRTLGVLLLCTTQLGLAALVFLNNRRALVNRLFGLSVLTIVGWIFSISFSLSSTSVDQTVLLGRIGFAFAAGIPFSLLCMFRAFSDTAPSARDPQLFFPGLLCAAFVLLSLSPWIVAGAAYSQGRPHFVYGSAHRLFGVYFLSCFILAVHRLWKTIQSSSGLKRLQLRYLLLGILLGGAGGTTTNLLIPLIWKTSDYSVLGPYFTLLMVSFSAHAIIRHRLMNIRLVVRRGLVYLLAATIAGGIFAALIAALSTLLADRRQDVPLATEVLVALAVALAFQPLKRWIQNALDRYFYREPYNYPQIIREASRRISSTLDLQSLLQYLCEVAGRTFRPDLIFVFVRQPGADEFSLAAQQSFADTRDAPSGRYISSADPLPSFLASFRRPVLRDELGRSVRGLNAESAVAQLSSLGGEFALPMFSEHQLLAFVVVGPKLSGDAYFAEDVELLSTLVNQAAIAVKNAQLYRQVVFVNDYIENILRTMDSGVITVDAHGKIALFNSTAERLTGLSKSLLTSLTIDQLPGSLAIPLKETLSDGQPRSQVEQALTGRDDRRVPIVCSTSALKDDRNTVVGALVVFSDLSKVKALESEKRRAERLAAFGTLVSGIAHEIKNPLVAIRTFAELLPERFAEVDFREEFSKVVVIEIDRIDDLVARLKGLAVPSLQQAAIVDIREPISETLALLRARLEQAHILVHRHFLAPTPLVFVDSAQLKQLFLNVFLNALEAMQSGGELTIVVRQREDHGSPWVTVEVADTGPGIPESIRSSVFDPFFTTKPRGSGLGLAICRGITDAHRGTIRAESNGRAAGTTIVVEFPVADRESSLAQQQALSI